MKNLTKLLLLPVVLLYGLCFGEVHAEIFDNSHKFIAWGLANKNIPNTDENIATIPSASDFPGVEIIVCNTSQNETITYKTVNNQTISGKQSGQLVNKVVNKVDKFISDGNNWYLE